jgi:hypothetical protein
MPEPYEVRKILPLLEAEVVTIPATEEKKGQLKWITSITVVTPSPKEEGRFLIEYRPMTSAGEILYNDAEGKDTTRIISVNNLYAFKDQIPELNAAFAAVLSCVNPVELALAGL